MFLCIYFIVLEQRITILFDFYCRVLLRNFHLLETVFRPILCTTRGSVRVILCLLIILFNFQYFLFLTFFNAQDRVHIGFLWGGTR